MGAVFLNLLFLTFFNGGATGGGKREGREKREEKGGERGEREKVKKEGREWGFERG